MQEKEKHSHSRVEEKEQDSYMSRNLQTASIEKDLQNVIKNLAPAISIIQEQSMELERILQHNFAEEEGKEGNGQFDLLGSKLLKLSEALSNFNRLALSCAGVISGQRADKEGLFLRGPLTPSVPAIMPSSFMQPPFLPQASWNPHYPPYGPGQYLSSPNNSPPKDNKGFYFPKGFSAPHSEESFEDPIEESLEGEVGTSQPSPEKSPQRSPEPGSPRASSENPTIPTQQPASEDKASSDNGQQQTQQQPHYYGRGGRVRGKGRRKKRSGQWTKVAERGGRGGGGLGRGN